MMRRCLTRADKWGASLTSSTSGKTRAISSSGEQKGAVSQGDVVIVGGGMVGSSLAAGLAQNPAFSNRKVVLLEASPEKPYQPLPPGSFTNRVSALNPHTAKFLDGLGAWNPHIAQKSHSFRRMYVWEECSPASIEFSEEEAMGHMVENDVTTAALTTVMKQQCHPGLVTNSILFC